MSFIATVLRQEEKLALNTQLYHVLKLLQMSNVELDAYLNDLSLENPLIDIIPPVYGQAGCYFRSVSGRVSSSSSEGGDVIIPDKTAMTLSSDLENQLLTMKLDNRLAAAVKYLIINLDEKGYLPPRLKLSAAWLAEPELFDSALRLLQSMEPAGVAAEDLSQCLCLQLERQGRKDSVAYIICRDYLEHLGRGHINHIVKSLKISSESVETARKLICSLNPIPSNGYDSDYCESYIIPDVEISYEDGKPRIFLNRQCIPSFSINSFYIKMLENPGISEEEKAYFKAKLTQANWVESAINSRWETLRKCAQVIAETQRDFFESGSSSIKVCTMANIADLVGVSVSTVSRALKNKYILCRQGTFPMSKFISHEVNGDSADELSTLVLKLIAEEDSTSPLSDNDIVNILNEKGYKIARRTVAKYRSNAGIPAASGRRKRN